MPFGLWTRVGPEYRVLEGVHNGFTYEWHGLIVSLSITRLTRKTSMSFFGRLNAGLSNPISQSLKYIAKLECGPMPNLMVALPNIGGAFCSTPQSLADAHY